MVMIKPNLLLLTFILMSVLWIPKLHIMNSLVLIEFMAINNIILMMATLESTQMENFMTLYLLIILITESIIGISMMINLIRTHGNDYTKSSLTIKF